MPSSAVSTCCSILLSFFVYVHSDHSNTQPNAFGFNSEISQHNKRRLSVVNIGNDSLDIDHFTIKLSNLNNSGTEINTLQATIFWGKYSFQCNFHGTTHPFYAGDIISCFPTNAATEPGPFNGNVPIHYSYRLQLDYIVNNNNYNDVLRIDSVKVVTNNNNAYEIDQFCVPKQFIASNAIISGQKCAEYSHKYLTDVVALDYYFVATLDIQFIDEIPNNYSNQPQVGNVAPLEPLDFIIHLTQGAINNTINIEYTVYWDEYIYHCIIQDSSQLIIHCNSTSAASIKCDHQSKYKIHIYNLGNNGESPLSPITIDAITVNLPSNTYTIGNFCIPNSFTEAQPTAANIGSCINNDFNDLPEWSQVTVPDSEAIIIRFPHDLFAADATIKGPMEGEVVRTYPGPWSSSGRLCDAANATTLYPTMDPTFEPTVSRNPTTEPTDEPTMEPTIEPTEMSTEPTIEPTMDPTINDGIGEEPEDDTDDLTIYIGAGVGGLCCCCLCVLIYIIYNDKQKPVEDECEPDKRMGNNTMMDIIDNHVNNYNVTNYRNPTEISLEPTHLIDIKGDHYKMGTSEVTMIELNDNKNKPKKISAPKKNKKMGNNTMMDIIDAVKDGDDMTTKTGKTMISDDIIIIMEDKEYGKNTSSTKQHGTMVGVLNNLMEESESDDADETHQTSNNTYSYNPTLVINSTRL